MFSSCTYSNAAQRITTEQKDDFSGKSSTTVGYVSVESSFQSHSMFAGIKQATESELLQFEEINTTKEGFSSSSFIHKKKSQSTSFAEKHKVVMQVIEQESSPLDSPQTTSGQWSDTGISTGEISNKPLFLDLQDASIGTDVDMSEMSPMNIEELGKDDHDNEQSQILSEGSDSPKPTTEIESSLRETTDVGTSPIKPLHTAVAVSPIKWEDHIFEDKGTDPVVNSVITCDVKLSPILFTESKGTSPMSAQGDGPSMVDASSSPPKRNVQSASTSPPKIFEYQSVSLRRDFKDLNFSKEESHTGAFEFDMDLDSPLLNINKKYVNEISEEYQSESYSQTLDSYDKTDQVEMTFMQQEGLKFPHKEEKIDELALGQEIQETDDVPASEEDLIKRSDDNINDVVETNLTLFIKADDTVDSVGKESDEEILTDIESSQECERTPSEDQFINLETLCNIEKKEEVFQMPSERKNRTETLTKTVSFSQEVQYVEDTSEENIVEIGHLDNINDITTENEELEDEHNVDFPQTSLETFNSKEFTEGETKTENEEQISTKKVSFDQEIHYAMDDICAHSEDAQPVMTIDSEEKLTEVSSELYDDDLASVSAVRKKATCDQDDSKFITLDKKQQEITSEGAEKTKEMEEIEETKQQDENETTDSHTQPMFQDEAKLESVSPDILYSRIESVEQTEEIYHVRVSEISSSQSKRLYREESNESSKQHDSKSDEIDELLLLVMPPGHARLNVEDQDESEFDHINAPRIIVTPTFDDYSDNQDSLQEDLSMEKKSQETVEESIFEHDLSEKKVSLEGPVQFVQPAIQCSVLHKINFKAWSEELDDKCDSELSISSQLEECKKTQIPKKIDSALESEEKHLQSKLEETEIEAVACQQTLICEAKENIATVVEEKNEYKTNDTLVAQALSVHEDRTEKQIDSYNEDSCTESNLKTEESCTSPNSGIEVEHAESEGEFMKENVEPQEYKSIETHVPESLSLHEDKSEEQVEDSCIDNNYQTEQSYITSNAGLEVKQDEPEIEIKKNELGEYKTFEMQVGEPLSQHKDESEEQIDFYKDDSFIDSKYEKEESTLRSNEGMKVELAESEIRDEAEECKSIEAEVDESLSLHEDKTDKHIDFSKAQSIAGKEVEIFEPAEPESAIKEEGYEAKGSEKSEGDCEVSTKLSDNETVSSDFKTKEDSTDMETKDSSSEQIQLKDESKLKQSQLENVDNFDKQSVTEKNEEFLISEALFSKSQYAEQVEEKIEQGNKEMLSESLTKIKEDENDLNQKTKEILQPMKRNGSITKEIENIILRSDSKAEEEYLEFSLTTSQKDNIVPDTRNYKQLVESSSEITVDNGFTSAEVGKPQEVSEMLSFFKEADEPKHDEDDSEEEFPNLCMLARSLVCNQPVSEMDATIQQEGDNLAFNVLEIVADEGESCLEMKKDFELYGEIPKTSIMTRTLSSENIQSFDEENESGFELTAGREMKSFDDSTLMEQSFDIYQERTDSLLQESTLHESLSMEKTISEPTLEPDLPSDGMEDIENESLTGIAMPPLDYSGEIVSETNIKVSSPDTTLTPESEIVCALSINAGHIQIQDLKTEQPTLEKDIEKPTTSEFESDEDIFKGMKIAGAQVHDDSDENCKISNYIKEHDLGTENESIDVFGANIEAIDKHQEIEEETDHQKTKEANEEEIKQDENNDDKCLSKENLEEQEVLQQKMESTLSIKENQCDHELTSSDEQANFDLQLKEEQNSAQQNRTRSFTRQLESQIQIHSQPVTETVEFMPIISWNLTSKESEVTNGTFPKELYAAVEIEHEDALLIESTSTEHCYSPGQDSVVYSSRCSERSGTQSSIELHTSSSKSDKYDYSSTSTSSKLSYDTETSSSSHSKVETRSASSSSKMTTSEGQSSSLSSHVTDSYSRSGLSGTASVTKTNESSHCDELEKSKTSSSQVASEKSHSKESSNNELSLSAHSLPSSPRRLRRAHSSGVKKITSEIFSTESDITRSLEIVYKEPAENSRRKLSEKYRHVSSNGASDGSISNDGQKIEKRKASVTLLKGRSDSNEQEFSISKALVDSSSRSNESSSESEEAVETKPKGGEPDLPLLSKKQPSPTKIRQPVTSLKPQQSSEEVISPVLQVLCQTPERSQKHLYKYVEGMSTR